MPYNKNRDGTVYIPTGNPDTVNYNPNYAPGELGVYYDYVQRSYQIVQLDSGATSATPFGAVAANQIAFWKDKTNYIVTNDNRFALGGAPAANSAYRNFVAGVFRNAGTPGNTMHILQRGNAINVASDGNGAIGDSAVVLVSASANQVTNVAAGTAPGPVPLGQIRGAAVSNVITVDLAIPSIN